MRECYFILLAPSLPDKLAWHDMYFVNVNMYPVPFETVEDAEGYRKVCGMTDEVCGMTDETSICKVSIIKN